ncbi:SDR family oxidoreductase [Sciscionella marina]|uniref:SDR family oxidoreductase n=1 Tax=Sciscionella marina TaxID=508770 RepID=UPI0003626B23|nr:SDR family oxidoreductase [Sciscionella marina]
MDLGIAGRAALVTGSTQGLGLACARALLAEGVAVTLNGRDADCLDQVRAELAEQSGGEVSCVAADLGTKEGLDAVFAACPTLDILVTNNRGPKPAPISTLADVDLDEALRLHLWAPFKLVQHYLPGMYERRFGRIVNITSAMVRTPGALMIASTAARSGLTGAMHGTATAVARDNVTINQVLPMLIDSPRQHNLARQRAENEGLSYDEVRAEQGRMAAARRMGRPEEVAAACAFLCSELAGFTTGMEFRVDGGGVLAVDNEWEMGSR